jgi:hypothetical protein
MKTIKKHNIGSPKRPGKKSKTAARTIYKKHNIGPPAKVIVTPDTPRSNEWKQIREKRNHINHEISDYEPDEDEEEVSESEPRTYTTFEETVTPFMKEALKKTPFTRSPMGSQVHKSDEALEKEWKKKRDDSPNKLHLEPENLITRKKHRPSRTRTKGRGRGRSRGRSRRNRG